jgi:hypothetical protein
VNEEEAVKCAGLLVILFKTNKHMNELLYDRSMIFATIVLSAMGALFFSIYIRERAADRREKARKSFEDALAEERREKREEERLAREAAHLEREREFRLESLQHEAEMRQSQAEEARARADEAAEARAGAGSGGYIMVELSDRERPLFHDLLKGFEDFAKLRGYDLSFSIDSSLDGKIAFKFTIKNDGVVVGSERVRSDFREYLRRVRSGNIDEFDNLPIVVTREEHELLLTVMKNRLNFLQHSYQLSQNTVQYYEYLVTQGRHFPALPATSVIVQTGGTMDSRNYNATNSSRLIQGESNTFSDSSNNLNIGQSFNERKEQVALLENLLEKLESVDGAEARKAAREISKAKDELVEAEKPDNNAVGRWIGHAKELLLTAKVGAEVAEVAKKVFDSFGLS